MSKTLTKILTLCGLFVVVVAAVVASAVCATAAIGYEVSVDVVKILNEDFNSPDGRIKIKINGKETNELLVKKGKEATITFEATDFEFQGFYKGGEGTYEQEDIILDENESLITTYKFVVNEATELSAVFKADQFYNFSVDYQTNTTQITDGRYIHVWAENCYVDSTDTDTYWVKKDGTAKLGHSEYGFKFDSWYVGAVSDGVKREDATITVSESGKTYTANFSEIAKCTVSVAPSYDEAAMGGTISATVNGEQNTVSDFSGVKIYLTTSATGYDFVNWTANGTVIGTTPDLEYEIADNAVIKANYTAIKYDISYDGAAAESVVWGSALKTVETSYTAENGWKVFTGWKYNGETVTQAKFDGTNRSIALNGEYFNQSSVTYMFTTEANVITYKTTDGDRLNKTLAPSKDYYNLTGITFVIGETNFEFAISGNNFVQVEGGKTLQELDQALMDSRLTTIAATPVYELAFDVNFTVKSNNAFGALNETKSISAGSKTDIATTKVLEYFANPGANLDSVRGIQVVCGDEQYTWGTGINHKEITIADVLAQLEVSKNNASAVNIEITIYA